MIEVVVVVSLLDIWGKEESREEGSTVGTAKTFVKVGRGKTSLGGKASIQHQERRSRNSLD